ncbi:MAG: hypothetical protein QOC70_553 [Verrucomicrobiota bacterium]|jgi:hypothetical protein
MPYYRRAVVALALLPFLFAGCKSADKPAQRTTSASRLFAVTVDSAAFFRHGPRQGREPDLKLPKDTVVKLIRPSFGYSKIQVVATGVQGYVASEEIRPASSTLLAAVTTPPADPMAVQTDPSAGQQFNLNSNDPRLVPPPEQLPDADLPAPAPEP